MEDVGSLVVKIAMDNSNFQQGVQNLNRSMKIIQSEFKNATVGLKDHGKGLEGLKAKQEMLSKSIDVQSKIVQKYKDKITESEKALEKSKQAHIKLKEKVDNAKKAYEDSSKSVGENAEETKKLKQTYDELNKKYADSEDKIRNNVRAIDNWNIKATNAETRLKGMKQSLNSVSSSIQQQENKWNKLSQKLDSIGKKFEMVGQKMSSMGKGLTAKLTGPIMGIGIAASKVGMDFEASMSNVSALSGTTGESLKKLEKSARNAGATTSKSAKDAADALGYMALAGYDNKQMQEALLPVLRLSEAGNLDLARTSDLVTDSLSSLGKSTKDLPVYLDQVAKTAASSNTNIDALMEASIVCGGTIKNLNIPLDEANALLGVLANRGLKGSEAGNSFNSILINLTSGAGQAGEAMKKLGLSAFDSHGKFKGVSKVLLELKDKTKNMTEEQRNLYLSMIGGKTQITTLQKLLSGVGEECGDLRVKIKGSNGALNEMATTMQANNKGSITQLKSALEELGLKIYDVLKPKIAAITKTFQEWTNKLNNLTPAQQETIIKTAGLVAAIGPLLIVGGKLASGINSIIKLGSGIVGLVGKISTLANVTSKLGLIAKAGPLLLNPYALAIAGIGVAGYATYKHLSKECIPAVDLFADKVVTTNKKIKMSNGQMADNIKTTTTKISGDTKKAVGSYLELDNKASKALINLNANSKNLTSSAKNTVIKNFSDMVNKSSGKGKELNTKMVKEFSNLVNNTSTLTEANKKAIVSKYTSMVLDCNKLTSKQKVDTVNKFKEILKETTGITKQQKDNLVAQYNQMGAQINAGYDKHYQERTAKLQKFFSTNTNLTVQEQQEILAKEKHHNEEMKASTNEYTEKIKSIFERASKEHRQLKADEVKDVKMYQDNMKENAIKTLSKNEVESKVILERIKSYSTSITTEQAAEVIKNAETQRVKSVDEANKQYIETTNNIKEMRDKTGSITEEQAKKMMEDAKKQRDETVKQANEQKQEVVKQISQQNSDVIKNIDTSNGQIKTKWQVLKEDISKKAHELKQAVVKAFEEKKAEITKKCSEIKTSIVNKWNEILSWFSTLPARLQQKGSEMFESMKQGINSKLASIKESCKNIGTAILNAFKDIPRQALAIGGHIIDGLKNGITNGVGKVVDAAKNLGNSITNKIKETLDIHSPSRVMEELGLFTDLGLANGVKNNAYLVEKEAKNLADTVLKEVSKLSNSNLDIKANVSAGEVNTNTRHILNWGDNNKQSYKEFIDFVNKLNTDEVAKSKELLDKDYKNRVKNLEDRLRVLKANTKNKNTVEINSLEVSKRALKDYYTLANNLLNKRSETVKNNLKTTENVFKDKLSNFGIAIKKLSTDTNNLNSKLEHQKAIVIVQEQKIQALKIRYEELCSTLGSTNEKTIEVKKSFEDAKNELINMSKTVEATNKEMQDKAVQDVDRLNSFIIKALERKVRAEEKSALETAKIKAKEHNMSKEQLEKFLAYVKSIYEKKLEQDVLQGQAEQLIMSKNQKSIVNLLNSYGDLYQDAGISLGQKLVLGTKSWSDVLPPLISNCMGNVVNTVGEASNVIGKNLSNVMGQIEDVAKAGQELAGACAGTDGKIDFDFSFNFDSVYKDWESNFNSLETKTENIAETISKKYKEAFNRMELAQIELGRDTYNTDQELKKQQQLLDIQRDKLNTLKSKYNEMSSALSSSDDEVVQLNKDIASLTIEIENQEKKLAADAIRNKYRTQLEAIELDTLKLTKSTKSFNEELDLQSDIYVNMWLKIDTLKDKYEELTDVLGSNADEVKALEKEIVSYQNEIDEFAKNYTNNLIANIDKFNSKIKDALKERYNSELKLKEDKISKELSNLNKWKDESIKRISEVYDSKIKSLDDELKAEDKFEKDREELKKIHSLEESLKFEHNEFNKAEIQKELNRAIADRNKRLHKENIESQKISLEEQKQNEINNINNLYASNKANLENQLNNTKKFYEEKLKMANLEAESQKLIVDNNQKEIVKLIKSYDKDYENAGKTLGQRLAEGMQEKISPVIDLIDSIQDRINNIRTQEIQASIDTVKYSSIASMGSGSINSTTNNSNSTVVNNNNITFNSPKALTPSEQRKNTETTLRKLAFTV